MDQFQREHMKAVQRGAAIILAALLAAGGAASQTALERAVSLFDDGAWDAARPLFEQTARETPSKLTTPPLRIPCEGTRPTPMTRT